MITGDHAITAEAIAQQLGIRGRAITGAEWAAMSDEQAIAAIDDIGVIARVTPQDKVRLVDILKAKGHIVAMTGDGVNDAPALKKADIGVAMGITGTEVSKEAAVMILTDDDFATIVKAVEMGRGLYDNLKKYIRFQMGGLFGFITAFLGASIFSIAGGIPFLPLQTLWINFTVTVFQAIGLGYGKPAEGLMLRKPRPAVQAILPKPLLVWLAFIGVQMGVVTLAVLAVGHRPVRRDIARSMGVTVFSIFNIAFAWATKDELRSLLDTDVAGDRYLVRTTILSVITVFLATEFGPLQRLLGTVSLTFDQWVICWVAGLSVLLVSEIKKRVYRKPLDEGEALVEPVSRPARHPPRPPPDPEVIPMPDQRFPRIHEFIEPFRVEPGRKVRLAKDFDPGYTGTPGQEGGRHRAAGGRRQAALRVPGAARRAGHLVAAGHPPGDGRRRQGRHDPPRDERRQPAGRGGDLVQGPVRAWSGTTTTCGGRRITPACAAATSASSTAPTTRSAWWCGSTRRSSRARRCPPRPRARTSGSAASGRSTTGSATSTDNGTKIVKLFLNVSKEEQRERFLARIGEPEKNWKFSAADARERRYWDDYQEAFEDLLSHTSTEWAPWHVIPADRKWFLRLGAAAVIIEAMMEIDPQFPTASKESLADMAAAKDELLAEGPLREGVIIKGINDGPAAESADAAGRHRMPRPRRRRRRARARRRADRAGQPFDRACRALRRPWVSRPGRPRSPGRSGPGSPG